MKPSRSKEERAQDQIERGLAADRLITDQVVIDWFAAERARVTEEMISAPIEDDDKRRSAALRLQALRDLHNHLTIEAALGRKQQERAKPHG